MNSTTRSHLVGYFYKIYVMMDGSMNINLINFAGTYAGFLRWLGKI